MQTTAYELHRVPGGGVRYLRGPLLERLYSVYVCVRERYQKKFKLLLLPKQHKLQVKTVPKVLIEASYF